MDAKNNLQSNSPYKRSQHIIKSKTVERHRCKKCQEKAKNKDNNEFFIGKERTKYIQQMHKKDEIKISNTSESSEPAKFQEKIYKDGYEIETRKKKGGQVTVNGEIEDKNKNKQVATKNRKKNHKHLKVIFSDLSETNSFTPNKKSGRENPHTRKKTTLHKGSNKYKRINLGSKVLIHEGEMQTINKCKLDECVALQVRPQSSTFSTSTNCSMKGGNIYKDEKDNDPKTYPLINIKLSAEENINNIIDIYETREKLNNAGGPVGDTDNLKPQSLNEMEDITKHKNIKEKEYLLAETGSQIEDLIPKGKIQNENQEATSNDIKKKSRFPKICKDTRKVEKEKKNLKKSGTNPHDNVTLSCDIYENSIGEKTPKSQRSLSDSCLRLKMRIYKYKSRKNKTLTIKRSTRNLSNNKQTKSLQNIKQNLFKRSSEFNRKNKIKTQELTNLLASKKNKTETEKQCNDSQLQKLNKHNIYYSNNNSNDYSITVNLSKITHEERPGNEDQWCFADPGIYSCDSELILDDGQKTANSSAPTQKFISQENSNGSWRNDKRSKSSISVFEIGSVASLEDFSDKFLGSNSTCMNSKDAEPLIHINTIQNEYNNKNNSIPKENYYNNGVFNIDPTTDSSNEQAENNKSIRLMQTFPHQSAVTLISAFGSKCTIDNQKISESDINKLNSSLKEIDISTAIKKDAAISASTSYEILRKTKFLTDKAIMCYEAVPLRLKKQRRDKLKKNHHNHHRETRHICDTLLGKQDAIHHSGCIAIPDILNQTDNETMEKNVTQHRKYRSIYSEKKLTERNNRQHLSPNKEILQNKDENKTNTFIRQEELEDVKMKFKDNFSIVYTNENVRPRQSKGFWQTVWTGSRRFIRFLHDSASFKYCFKKE